MTSAKHVAEGGPEALRALFNTIEPGADKNISPEALQRLSEKLTEFSGGMDAAKDPLNINRGGEHVNEEGLPIIDINEPDFEIGSSSNKPFAEPDLIPLSSLSPAEVEVRKRERNRVLDMLEAEEEMLERKSNEAEKERRREALQNMKEAGREGVKNFAQTREMQKKMGKALLRNMAAAREKEEKEKAEKEAEDLRKEKARTKKGPQKTVTFAVPEKEDDKEEENVEHEWGDVAQGRLTSTKRPTLLSKFNDSTLPMKMSVVERPPGQSNSPPETPQNLADSDDESEPPLSEGGSSSDNPSDADEDVEEGFDMDYAQHQREIALEYHKKRETIGRDVSLAMRSHTHEEDEEEQPSSSAPKKKTPLSHFKSERLASSYGASAPSSSLSPTSQSLGASILPASGAETLRNAIRVGKLDSENRLVGTESDSEGDNEEAQEIIRLLEKGEAYNAGPSKVQSSTNDSILPENLPPLLPKTKPSKFKAARSQAGRPATPSSQSDSSTPVSNVARSSPKLPPAIKNVPPSATVIDSPSFPAGDVMSMIVESPSFPQPQPAPTSRPMVVSSAVRESSQPPRRESSRPQRPPTVVPVSSLVKETNPSGSQPVGEPKPFKKVSRFMAERS
ncbi:uncharacterized protein EV420DRAFT_1638740 [Desarmillaria tabescens]|uniref:DUF3835 domain-containing protein n=1 Tax=Armillaria tabescens TaxID=1929756 RepID=A0AA39TM42_ARMTA|nr:uncharacterized protein EV420DRAFT_1638740 [Desarmillaria tabescens]KAK0463827.1 hypothetical protein EV420DRAFT_1638740 [Desarmillaria tabescens]